MDCIGWYSLTFFTGTCPGFAGEGTPERTRAAKNLSDESKGRGINDAATVSRYYCRFALSVTLATDRLAGAVAVREQHGEARRGDAREQRKRHRVTGLG